jgi:hypothetical protein
MQCWTEELERREVVRTRQRLDCEVWVGGDRHQGVLEQASARCVLVRLDEPPRSAGEARVRFVTPDGAVIALRALAEKARVTPHAIRSLVPPSVVMHVLEPPDAFLRWIDGSLPSAP